MMPRTVIILYEHFTPSVAHMGRGMWTAYFEDNQEAYDYNTKSSLIASCKKDKHNYKVMRQHRNGTQTVIEKG